MEMIRLSVKIWPDIRHEINLRLNGVNTPEKRGAGACEKEAARLATAFTKAFIGDNSVIIHDIKQGKYAGRMLGNLSVNDKDLGQALINAGHALYYDGKKRKAWECKESLPTN